MNTLYDNTFFRQHHQTNISASEVFGHLKDWVDVQSVLDVGCGIGVWLSEFQSMGSLDFVGIDGDYLDTNLLVIPKDHFVVHDLKTQFTLGRKFDLVMSLEVAEHLPPNSAPAFIESLCVHGDVILFSAAAPNQGGVGHLNEQWPAYWAQLFVSQGFVTIDCLRHRLWESPDVLSWYCQNIFMAVKSDKLTSYPLLAEEHAKGGLHMLPLVHPRKLEALQYYVRPDMISLPTATQFYLAAVKEFFNRKLARKGSC